MSKRSLNEKQMLNEADPSADVVFLRERIAALEGELATQKSATGEAMEIVTAIQAAVKQARPVAVVPSTHKGASKPITHALHLTDLHYGQVTDASEVDGFGEFSPDIAERRIAELTGMILRKTRAQRAAFDVPVLHIIGTADYISGDIHQELQVSNAFPAPVQAVKCGYMLGGMLMAFAPHFERVVVDLVTLDNHGRMTRKPQSTQGGQNNWGFVVAHIAAQHVAAQPNVKVNIHAKPSALIAIGSERYLAFHGHQIKGWAGIPYYGLDRRAAMEAIKRMGLPDVAFTKLLSGHLHHAVDGMVWRTGGSLSGTDAHDHNCGRKSPPHQTSWFVHPTHGEFDFTRWWL